MHDKISWAETKEHRGDKRTLTSEPVTSDKITLILQKETVYLYLYLSLCSFTYHCFMILFYFI